MTYAKDIIDFLNNTITGDYKINKILNNDINIKDDPCKNCSNLSKKGEIKFCHCIIGLPVIT